MTSAVVLPGIIKHESFVCWPFIENVVLVPSVGGRTYLSTEFTVFLLCAAVLSFSNIDKLVSQSLNNIM